MQPSAEPAGQPAEQPAAELAGPNALLRQLREERRARQQEVLRPVDVGLPDGPLTVAEDVEASIAAQVWPGGVALARALPELAEHARGRGVEVGAGLGVAADRRIFCQVGQILPLLL